MGTLVRNNLGIFTCFVSRSRHSVVIQIKEYKTRQGPKSVLYALSWFCFISPAGWVYLKFWLYRWYHGHNRIIFSKDICCYTTFKKLVVYFSQKPQTDRQTDRYFIDRNKSHYRLICHSNKRDICTCIYKNVSLLKSYKTIYMV